LVVFGADVERCVTGCVLCVDVSAVEEEMFQVLDASTDTHLHIDHSAHASINGLALIYTHALDASLSIMHLIHIHKSPSYLKDMVTPTAAVSSRGRLRSASSSRYEQLQMRLKFGQRCFSYAAPAAWNTLPPSLQQLTHTDSFKRQLKTVLFERAFS